MRLGVLFALLFWLAGCAGLFAVESGFQAMTIVRAEQKTHDRIVYWVVNTPIYQEDPYFAVTVRVAGILLEAEYEPRRLGETLPEAWKPGVVVQGRLEKRTLILRRPNGTEMHFVVVKRRFVPEEKAPVKKVH